MKYLIKSILKKKNKISLQDYAEKGVLYEKLLHLYYRGAITPYQLDDIVRKIFK